MGLFRLINPLCLNATAPRHRQARALERTERMLREALADAVPDRAPAVPDRTPAPASSSADQLAVPVRWSDGHAAAIMAAHAGGDRAGVDLAIAAARASVEA